MSTNSDLPPTDADDDELTAWINARLDSMEPRVKTWRYRVMGKTVAEILAERAVAKKHLSLSMPADAYSVFMTEVRAIGLKPATLMRRLIGNWLLSRGKHHPYFDLEWPPRPK
jgi:hypothetical protein